MRRTLMATVTGAALLAVGLTACGGGTGASSGDDTGSKGGTTIKLVAAEYSDTTQAFWDAFATTYHEKTGNTLDVQVVSWNDIDQQSSTMIQNNSAPDILNLNAYASYAKDDLLYSADDVLSSSVKSDLLPNFVTSGTYDGKLYGMPDLSSSRALFYNKALFQQAGISQPPTTWDEFVQDAKAVTALGNGTVGYAEPLGPEESQAEFSIWMFNNGGDWKTDGKWSINSTQNVATLQFLKDLAVTDKVTQNNPGKTNRTDGAFPLFTSGKAGMIVGFSPLQSQLDQDATVDYGIAPMPTNTGDAPASYGVTDYLMAFKKPGNQDAVKAFYDLYYQKDQVNTFIKQEGFLPVTQSGVEQFESDASLSVYLQNLSNTKLTPTDDPTWDTIKLAVQQQLGAAVDANGNPQQVLDALQQQATSGG